MSKVATAEFRLNVAIVRRRVLAEIEGGRIVVRSKLIKKLIVEMAVGRALVDLADVSGVDEIVDAAFLSLDSTYRRPERS